MYNQWTQRDIFNKIVNINHIITKYPTVVPFACNNMFYTFWQETHNICKSYVKIYNGPKFDDKNSLPSVLNLRFPCVGPRVFASVSRQLVYGHFVYRYFVYYDFPC